MDFIITFFRDILDGPLYIVVTVISVILICSCIGYLAEVSLNKKKAKKQYEASYASIDNVNQSQEVPINNLDSVTTTDSNNLNGDSVPEILVSKEKSQMNIPQVPTSIPTYQQQQVQMPSQSVFQQSSIPNVNSVGTTVPVPEVVNTVNNVNR